MIPTEELEKIKDCLKRAENPLFFFDDDNDGLCSFILFRQFTGKGEGVPIKVHPALDANLLNKVEEHRPDYIFILDKPLVAQEFVEGVSVPVIWLDHHPLAELDGVRYFNPKQYNKDDASSTTYWAYKTVGGKLWIGCIGAVSDWTIPDYFNEFSEEYPDLTNKKDNAPDLLYDSKFGELCRIFSFLIKGKTSDVKRRIKTVLKIEDPYDILDQKTKEGKYLFEESEKINNIYRKLFEKALKTKVEDGFIVFTYACGDLSLTSDLSNELLYRNPGKIILVGREKNGEMKISLRSDKFRIDKTLEKVLQNVDGYGGGHKFAVGASVKVEDFSKFVESMKKEISRQ